MFIEGMEGMDMTVKRVAAVIEDASLHKIGDLFKRKPKGLKLNETEALVVKAKTADGIAASRIFFFCLKPDGTFDEESIARDGSRFRRHRLGAFLRHYGIASDTKDYNIRDDIGGWRGKAVDLHEGTIYVP